MISIDDALIRCHRPFQEHMTCATQKSRKSTTLVVHAQLIKFPRNPSHSNDPPHFCVWIEELARLQGTTHSGWCTLTMLWFAGTAHFQAHMCLGDWEYFVKSLAATAVVLGDCHHHLGMQFAGCPTDAEVDGSPESSVRMQNQNHNHVNSIPFHPTRSYLHHHRLAPKAGGGRWPVSFSLLHFFYFIFMIIFAFTWQVLTLLPLRVRQFRCEGWLVGGLCQQGLGTSVRVEGMPPPLNERPFHEDSGMSLCKFVHHQISVWASSVRHQWSRENRQLVTNEPVEFWEITGWISRLWEKYRSF